MKRFHIERKIGIYFLLISFSFLQVSCESYLNQSPDAGVGEADAFKDFVSFQGYVEGIYMMVTNPHNANGTTNPNLADEGWTSINYGISATFDAGDYTTWMTSPEGYFGRNLTFDLKPGDKTNKGMWPSSWYGIYAANKGLANLDKLIVATQQERDVLKGQMLFLRGYFYFCLMREWGGLPYLTEPIDASGEIPQLPRLHYQQTAELAAKDMADAANLLPLNWDAEPVGQLTIGNNRLRINKIIALSFEAKCLLYAASPLMNFESKGLKTYDTELCKRSAKLFKEVIDLSDSTGLYALQSWSTINDVFFKTNREYPGGTEMIWAGLQLQYTSVLRSYFMYLFQPPGNPYGSGSYFSLSYKYSKNFGMKNGLPITDPASGYNSLDPWSNRDPRFDAWVLVDGEPVTKSVQTERKNEFAQFFTGGFHRGNPRNESGIGTSKFWDITCNYKDNSQIDNRFVFNPPLIRLGDVYLMYAEAVLFGYGNPQSIIPDDDKPLSALEAVNLIRERANVPDIDAKFTSTQSDFFEQLVVERSVELFCEGFRWIDLRRWFRNGDPRYLEKTIINFDRAANGKPINLNETLYRKRVVADRNNWLPMPINQVSIYPEFGQNPGW